MFNVRTVLTKNIRNQISLKNCFKTYGTSTQPAIHHSEDQHEKQIKDFETLTNITRKVRIKKPQKPPFAKNLFLGIFDTDILTYPQMEKEDVENLERNITAVNMLVKENDVNNELLDKKFVRNLSDYRVVGLQASQFMDGRECNITESLRFLEVLSEHHLRDSIVCNEQLGVQALVKFASEQLKKKYLYRIIKGESLTAFCLSETSSEEMISFKTKAELSQDEKTWILNGEKNWVINGVSSDILIVVAVSDIVLRDVNKEARLTAFVVDKSSPGITVKKNDTSGIEIADIAFKDTPVPTENVIGEANKAEAMVSSLITDFRLSIGAMCLPLTKKIVNGLTRHIIDQSTNSNILYKTDAMRGKIGEMATSLYAMESITYLTSGLIDNYENLDCELECAIVKAFSAETTVNASVTCLDLLGAPATCESHWANMLHKEALRILTLHESNDSLKMIIALLGLQFAGNTLKEEINKIRNPMFHSGLVFKRMWTTRKNVADKPNLNLYLNEHLHPSMENASKYLEYCIKRLEFGTEILLVRHGSEIMNHHMDLRRLADCIIDIYAMTACIGRASRSYCIGLQHSDYELLLANTFCNYAKERVQANVNKIYVGDYLTNDENYRSISKRQFKLKEYFLKHPLARNF